MLGTLRFMVEDFKEYISDILRNKLWHAWYILETNEEHTKDMLDTCLMYVINIICTTIM